MCLKAEGLYYIGGVVRDSILGVESFDVDITYVGDAIEFAKAQKDLDIIQVNEDFRTVKVLYNGKEMDIASTRDEIYPNVGHLPVVSNIGCSLEVDAKRRDFTINAIAKSTMTSEIIDYLGGQQDIKDKKLRIIHDKSFIDDPTRIIRGLKFSVRFGFELEDKTKRLQDEYLANINYDMSYKRVKKELIETFNLNSQIAYNKFFGENVYKLLTSEKIIPYDYNIQNLIEKYPVDNPWLVYLGWMDLSALPLTKKELKIIEDYNKIKQMEMTDDYSIYMAFKNCEKESLLLYALSIDEKLVFKYLDDLSQIKINLTGRDLIEMGIEPSSKFSQCFEYVIREKIKNKDIDEHMLVKEFFEINK